LKWANTAMVYGPEHCDGESQRIYRVFLPTQRRESVVVDWRHVRVTSHQTLNHRRFTFLAAFHEPTGAAFPEDAGGRRARGPHQRFLRNARRVSRPNTIMPSTENGVVPTSALHVQLLSCSPRGGVSRGRQMEAWQAWPSWQSPSLEQSLCHRCNPIHPWCRGNPPHGRSSLNGFAPGHTLHTDCPRSVPARPDFKCLDGPRGSRGESSAIPLKVVASVQVGGHHGVGKVGAARRVPP